MRVDVLSVDNETGTVRVAMLGTVLCVDWCGCGLPSPGEQHVEFDCRPVNWSDVRSIPRGPTAPESAEDGVIRADVIDLEHDGVVWLLASGDELLIDSLGEPPIGIVGTRIEFVPDGGQVYPSDL